MWSGCYCWMHSWHDKCVPMAVCCRLIHSPRLVVIGLSMGCETWPPIGWHHAFVIGWGKYRLGLHGAPLHYGLTWLVGITTVFYTPLTVPLHSPNGRQICLPLGLCGGTVKESMSAGYAIDNMSPWNLFLHYRGHAWGNPVNVCGFYWILMWWFFCERIKCICIFNHFLRQRSSWSLCWWLLKPITLLAGP